VSKKNDKPAGAAGATVPADLPKVRSAVPPQWLLELHFKAIDGHVFLSLHAPGKPQFPFFNGVLTNGIKCAEELVQALTEAKNG
jgi:hypothetical protein